MSQQPPVPGPYPDLPHASYPAVRRAADRQPLRGPAPVLGHVSQTSQSSNC